MNKKREFEKIYKSNVDKIYRFLFLKTFSKSIAEDLTSKTFLKGWQFFKKEKIENPLSFLYRTAQNLLFDYWRKEKKVEILPLDERILKDEKYNPLPEIERKFEFEKISEALRKLPQEDQNILIWYYVEGFKINEIAKILEKSEGATRVLISRALKKLKNILIS